MPRLSLWNSGRKGNDHKFIDRIISEMFGAGGTAVYLHKYLGPYEHEETIDINDINDVGQLVAKNNEPSTGVGPTRIQDVLFLENRDRRYDPNVYELRGVYNVQDAEFDLRQFGLFLENDTVFMTFHFNDMIGLLGRKIMPGDVIELPHLRDFGLDPDTRSINKFYVVQDANYASEGYAPTWWPHLWRVKLAPMPGSQEFSDILNNEREDRFGVVQERIGDLMSNLGNELNLNEQVVDAARQNVKRRNFETQQFYVVPGDETTKQNPWVFAGDGVPPNGAELLGSGTAFPSNPAVNDYYLRTDYEPHALFRWTGRIWCLIEVDYRKQDWSMAHRLLHSFIQNQNMVTHDDKSVAPEKVALSRAVRPRADF